MLQGVTLPGVEYQALAANQAPDYLTPAEPVFQFEVNEHDRETTDVSSSVDIDAEEFLSAAIIAAPEEVLLAEPASHNVPGLEDQNNPLAYTHSNHKTDVGSLGHQSVVIVEQDGSHEPDIGVTRCPFCECGTSCQDCTYSCCKLCEHKLNSTCGFAGRSAQQKQRSSAATRM